jgi:SdpC family antimicrobial peptide
MNILSKFRKPYFAMFLASLILFVSCEQYDNDVPINSTETSIAKFSGQELFSSIIFMDGRATSLFPIIENSFNIKGYLDDSEKRKEYRELQQKAIQFLQAENSVFFNDFQKSMYSQDPLIIKEAIINGAKILRPFLNEELKGKGLNYDITINNQKEIEKLKLSLNDEYGRHQKNQAVAEEVACGVLALAALVVVVAAVAFYVVVISEFWVGVEEAKTDLFSEELSYSIATKLQE